VSSKLFHKPACWALGYADVACEVISRTDEAKFGWVAANHSQGHASPCGFGYVNMGGASAQIAFFLPADGDFIAVLPRWKWVQSPFSLNTHYLADCRSKFIAHYKGAQEKYEQADLVRNIGNHKPISTQPTGNCTSPASQQPTSIARVLASLSEIGIVGIKGEDLPKLLPPDRIEPALGTMADVRAYFQG